MFLWYMDSEYRTFIQLAAHFNPASHQFKVFADNVQAKPGTLDVGCILCAEKSFKEVLLILFRYPHATVFYADRRLSRFKGTTNFYHRFLRRKFDGIRYQVNQDVTDQVFVRCDSSISLPF